MKFLKFCIHFVSFALINCAPADYDGQMDIMPSDIYDIDTEQLQARYDPRLLSEDVSGYHSTTNEDGTACRNSNARYVHGQKVPRSDPCEICLCVDGEIFCWWRKCDHYVKKPTKHVKHHYNNHKSHNANKNRKIPNKWLVENIPKAVLNFPQHLPTHILDEDDIDDSDDTTSSSSSSNNNNDDGDDGSNFSDKLNKNKEIETQIASQIPNHGPSTITKTEIPENLLSSSRSSSTTTTTPTTTTTTTTNSGDLGQAYNDDDDIDTNEPNDNHQTTSNDKLRIITANPIIIDSKITQDSGTGSNYTITASSIMYGENEEASNIDGITNVAEEKGYYEKTIINKNGVFIENIRKIVNIDEEQQRKASISDSADRSGGQRQQQQNVQKQPQPLPPPTDDYDESINRKNIALVSVPLSQHYVITSSGKIEKTDPLANDDVIEQFRDGLLNDYQRQPLLHHITTTDNSAGGIINSTESGTRGGGGGGGGGGSSSTATVTTIAAITASNIRMGGDAGADAGSMAASATVAHDGGSVYDNGSDNDARTDDVKQFKCIVMGTSYAVGTVLPQEPGNCLQCVCSAGNKEDLNPRVTCSSHNCPPLILPDLFDADNAF